MPRPPRLIAELIALTRSWGWSVRDLAREIDVSYETLKHYRAGRRELTMRSYSSIASVFGERHPHIKHLAWQYACTLNAPDVADPAATAATVLRAADIHVLRMYVERFATESVHGGKGLFLVGDNPQMLTAAVALLSALIAATDVKVCVLRADRAPSASEQRDALAAPLLIIERVEFLCDGTADLVRRRADLLRPTVATSLQPPSAIADAYLRRIFLSVMRTLALGAAAETTPALDPSSHDYARA